jgi:hypothetical protein
MAAQLVEIHSPTVRQMRARTRVREETGNRQASATEARWGATSGPVVATVVQETGAPVLALAERESAT